MIRVLAEAPAILTDVRCSFLQSLETNAGIPTRLGHDRFLLNPFQFIIQLSSSGQRYSIVRKSEHSNVEECRLVGCGAV
jgi:hypothetical protein